MKLIKNGKIYSKEGFLENHCILFEERIREIKPIEKEEINLEYEIDAKDCYIVPGFIDIHIHGIKGADVMDGRLEALDTMAKELVKHGVTAFLPTTMTMELGKIEEALNNIRNYMSKPLSGARALGAHLEGPYINKAFKGAQNEKNIIEPNIEWVRKYYDIIKIITIAPEVDGGLDFIKKVKEESDIVLSIGHSNGAYNTCKEAFNSGASHITHLFNAMKPLHHREPGVVGAALDLDFTCEVILDNIHINPLLYNFILKVKGIDKLIAITDCMRAGCLHPGEYELGGQKVIVNENSARLESGQLAGSVLKFEEILKNIISNSKVELIEAIKMMTVNPAKLLGRNDMGILEKGALADFVVINNKFEIITTVINGEVVFEKGESI